MSTKTKEQELHFVTGEGKFAINALCCFESWLLQTTDNKAEVECDDCLKLLKEMENK